MCLKKIIDFLALFDFFEINPEAENAFTELTQKMSQQNSELIDQKSQQQFKSSTPTTTIEQPFQMANLSLRDNLSAANYLMANFVVENLPKRNEEITRPQNFGSPVVEVAKRSRISSISTSEKRTILPSQQQSNVATAAAVADAERKTRMFFFKFLTIRSSISVSQFSIFY